VTDDGVDPASVQKFRDAGAAVEVAEVGLAVQGMKVPLFADLFFTGMCDPG
jgi:hypothetical protein